MRLFLAAREALLFRTPLPPTPSGFQSLPDLGLFESDNTRSVAEYEGRKRALGVVPLQLLKGALSIGAVERVDVNVLVSDVQFFEEGLRLLAPYARAEREKPHLTPVRSFDMIHVHDKPPVQMHPVAQRHNTQERLKGTFARLSPPLLDLFGRPSLFGGLFFFALGLLSASATLAEAALPFLLLFLQSIGFFSSLVTPVSAPFGHSHLPLFHNSSTKEGRKHGKILRPLLPFRGLP